MNTSKDIFYTEQPSLNNMRSSNVASSLECILFVWSRFVVDCTTALKKFLRRQLRLKHAV